MGVTEWCKAGVLYSPGVGAVGLLHDGVFRQLGVRNHLRELIPPLCQSLAAERHLGKGLASAVSAAKYGWAKVWACLPVL